MLVCPRCGYKTERVNDFKKHIFRKNMCEAINNVSLDALREKYTTTKTVNYKCEHCFKEYTSRSGYLTHTRACTAAQTNNSSIETLFKELINALKPLEYLSCLQNITNNNLGNNIAKKEPMDFGQHDVSFVINNHTKMKTFFDKKEDGIVELIKEVWMNPSYPQNISFKATKEKVQVLCKKTWQDTKWTVFLNNLLDYVGQIFEEYVSNNAAVFTKTSLDSYMMQIGVPLDWNLYHDTYDFSDTDKVAMPEKTRKKIFDFVKKSILN